MRVGQPRLQCDGTLQVGNRVGMTAELGERAAGVGRGFRRGRIESRGLHELDERLVAPRQAHERDAEREARVGKLRVRAHFRGEHPGGARRLAEREQAVAQAMPAALARRRAMRRLERAERLGVAPLVEQARAEQARRVRVRRILLQRAPGVRLGRGQVVGLERAPALGQAHALLPSRCLRRESVSGVRFR